MKKIIITIFVCLLVSCSPKTYVWEGKKVTLNKYFRKWSKSHDEFIKKYKPRIVWDSSYNFRIEYDSTNLKK